MKKFPFYLWLIALMGLITSCGPNETDTPAAGESNRVSFTASLPADFAQPGTRALPTLPTDNNVQYKLRCILEVWSQDLSTLIVRKEEVPAADAIDIRFEFELANPAEYKALFWADYIEPNADETLVTTPNSYTHYKDNCYTTSGAGGLKAVEILDFPANPLVRDAFFACKDFKKGVEALTGLKATLTRPFAKLTIAEKSATNFGYCKEVKVTHTVPDALNVATGAVSGTRTLTGLAYAKPEEGGFGNDVTINGEACKTLFVTYIFAGDDDTAGEIALEFTPADGNGKTLKTVTIPAGIPLKRNYCTNAAGSLITEAVTPSPNTAMTVDIQDTWGTPDTDQDIATTINTWDGQYPADVATAKAWLGEEVSGKESSTAKDHVFEISTAKQLAGLYVLSVNDREKLNNTNSNYLHATYKLTADIHLNNHPWSPIGYDNQIATLGFFGVFDGQGHTVSGLKINTDRFRAGFINSIYSGGIVKHLTVKGDVVYSGTGGAGIGGIASENEGIIAFCSFEGTVKAPYENTSESCLGWICGKNIFGVSYQSGGQIISCFAKGTISGASGVVTGGMTGTNTYPSGYSGSVSGCTWYYKSGATPEGIAACYSGWTSGGSDANASYSDDSELAGRAGIMNQNATDYDYQWQAVGSTLKLVAKTQ